MTRRVKLALLFGIVAALVPGTIAVGSSLFESQGQQFHYFGPATDATDPDQPESSDNDVARFDTTGVAPVGMTRKVDETVFALDNQLEFKYFYVGRSCGAGSPRIQLAVDVDGDGDTEGNLHGHVRPPYSACAMNKWVFEDTTDDERRWEIGAGLPGARPFPFYTWTEVEGLLGAATVRRGSLIEDSHAFSPANKGEAFYDRVQIGNEHFEDHNDSANTGVPAP
ncbi:MAG TPA: hypothetical protein VGW10_05225 [Solirubrobacteraceae bacterium]|nr:hypothetical protein [Solirubrobacteraceae bacterium]